MNPHQRLSWTLVISLIIWTPIVISMLNGGIEFWTCGLYYVGALVFAYIGTGIIQRLTDNYRETQNAVHRAKRQIEMIEKQNEADLKHNRRSTDVEDPEAPDDL